MFSVALRPGCELLQHAPSLSAPGAWRVPGAERSSGRGGSCTDGHRTFRRARVLGDEPRGGRSLCGSLCGSLRGRSQHPGYGDTTWDCLPWSGFEVKSMEQVGGHGTINTANRFPSYPSPATTGVMSFSLPPSFILSLSDTLHSRRRTPCPCSFNRADKAAMMVPSPASPFFTLLKVFFFLFSVCKY